MHWCWYLKRSNLCKFTNVLLFICYLSAWGGGLKLLPIFLKERGRDLTGSQFFEGGCWERGGDLFLGWLQFLVVVRKNNVKRGDCPKTGLRQFAALRGGLAKKEGGGVLEETVETSMHTIIWNQVSTLKEISIGDPQKLLLIPLLFVIFINDLQKCMKYSKTYNFGNNTREWQWQWKTFFQQK